MSGNTQSDLAQLLRQQETLRTIIESISSELELRPLLTRIVQHACELLHADRGTIGLVDPECNVIRTEAVYQMPPDELGAEMEPGVGLAGHVLETQQPIILNQYGKLERPMHLDLIQDAVIGAPIFWHDRMIAFFGIGAEPPRTFDEHDLELLQVLGRHAAIAIENARLFAAEKRRAARQAALNQIAKVIAGTLDLSELLQTAVDAIGEHLHYSHTGVMLIDDQDPQMMIMAASSGILAEKLPADYRQSIYQGIMGAAVRTRRPAHTSDVKSDPRYLRVPGADDIQSAIGVPIIFDDEVIGVLHVESRQRLQPEDAALLEIAADQLGVAISNARLFAAEKRRSARQAALNRVGKLVASSLDPETLLQTTVQAISHYLHYTNVALLIIESDDPETLTLRASSGVYVENVANGYQQSIYQGNIGLAARTRKPVLVPDVSVDANYIPIPGQDAILSELALPIIISNELLGVLNVESTVRLTPEDQADFEIVTDQLGVAISNAHLFTRTQQSLAEKQLLYETSLRMSTALNIDDVIVAYLEQVAARGRYVCTVALYTFDEAGERTHVDIRGRWTPQDGLEVNVGPVPYSQDQLDEPLDAGETVTINNVHTDPRASKSLRQMQQIDGRPALAFIPLMVRGQRIGLVILSYSQPYEWPEADLWPYQITAVQLATAIYTRQQQQLVYESGREVAVLRERQRLARELHDSVTQLIFSMTLIAQSISPAWQRDPQEGEKRVSRLLELSQNALAEMRALLFELRSEAPELPSDSTIKLPGLSRLRRDGLVAALEKHVAFTIREGPAVIIDAGAYEPQSPDREIALFRITQEALNNVSKHAQAELVMIRLYQQDDVTCLTVRDNGVGFAAAGVGNGRFTTSLPSGLGLRTMRERTEALGGKLQITSQPGAGTEITVWLPK